MPTPTQVNTDDIRELKLSHQQLTVQVGRLADEIRDLAHEFHEFRLQITRDLNELKLQITRDLGEIKADLRATRSQLETWISAGKIAIPIAVAVIAWIGATAFNASSHANKLDGQMSQLIAKLDRSIDRRS